MIIHVYYIYIYIYMYIYVFVYMYIYVDLGLTYDNLNALDPLPGSEAVPSVASAVSLAVDHHTVSYKYIISYVDHLLIDYNFRKSNNRTKASLLLLISYFICIQNLSQIH